MNRGDMEYTRDVLVNMCYNAIVPQEKWCDRDSAESQKQVGQCMALLLAGCDYEILHGGDYCSTDERTVWLEVRAEGFDSFETGGELEHLTFYLPTAQRVRDAGGGDWY